MKTKFILLTVAICFTVKISAQIKIFSGGATSYGSTSAPYSGEKHHFSGDVMISSVPTISLSCIYLRGNNGYSGSSNPDYSWTNDNGTGFFHPSNNVLGFSTGGTERMRLISNGNLLIGTTTDNSNRLQVTGGSNQCAVLNTVNYTSNTGWCQINQVNQSGTYALSVYSSHSGSNVNTFKVEGKGDCWNINNIHNSDRNLKENIDTLTNALSKIKQLKGVKYNFKASFIGKELSTIKEIGLIAQDVEMVIPEVVVTDREGMKGIKYSNIIAYLIEAIKEQDKQISKLQSEVNNCCSKINSGATNVNKLNSSNINLTSTGFNDNIETNPFSYMRQNAPNPFSKETTIDYFITEKNANASILIFDMNGKLLKTLKLNGNGNGSVIINGNDLQPGMYYYSLIVNGKEIDTKKMILTE